MSALVTLVTAKEHLRITSTTDDADIQLKLDQAEAIILDYLAGQADPGWISPATAPKPVTASILLMLTRLYEHRGDLEEADEDLWLAIERILRRIRREALA